MVLVKNWPYFSPLYFRQNSPGKCVSRYCRKKKRLSRLRKTKSPKRRKIGIFQKKLVHGLV